MQRLVTLYDPTNPILRSRLIQCQSDHKKASYSQQSSQCDSADVADNIVSTKSFNFLRIYLL
jgi:hypothetical protein